MDNANTKVIFEHPLNEKMRTWLRIEFLIKQLNHNRIFNENNALLFFHSLSELLEIVERNDIRGDLSKDLEEQKQKLSLWLNVQGVNAALLTDLIETLNTILHELAAAPKLGQDLKHHKFIASIRKRLTIPGGCCSFDLPSFYLWLQKPQAQRDRQINEWLDSFSTLYQAMSTYMQLVRQTSVFKSFTSSCNFYQNPTECVRLLRIKLSMDKGIYPQVSGNASRYTINFVHLETPLETKTETNCVEFELANC